MVGAIDRMAWSSVPGEPRPFLLARRHPQPSVGCEDHGPGPGVSQLYGDRLAEPTTAEHRDPPGGVALEGTHPQRAVGER